MSRPRSKVSRPTREPARERHDFVMLGDLSDKMRITHSRPPRQLRGRSRRCQRGSPKEFEDALNRMAHLMGRAQKQQYEIMSIFGKQAAAMEALVDFVA